MRHARRSCPRVVAVKATQVQGLDNEALIELAHERREDPLIAELADRLAEALDDLERAERDLRLWMDANRDA